MMITGSYPPDVCGVGDYTACLSEALGKKGVQISVITTGTEDTISPNGLIRVQRVIPTWSSATAARLLADLCRGENPDIIHIQYPTVGFGAKLGPHLTVVMAALAGRPTIVTIHEARRANPLRQASLLAFSGATRIVVTTSKELEYLQKTLYRWKARRLQVINIGSNIPKCDTVQKTQANVCTYFGLFYPRKGVEDFLEIASRAQKVFGSRVQFQLLGNIHPHYKEYYQYLRDKWGDIPCRWLVGADVKTVAGELANSLACILPFPDGATFRRGSLLAALCNGVPVITTRSNDTPIELIEQQCAMFASTQDDFLRAIDALLIDPDLCQRMTSQGLALGARFTWDRIAGQHLDLYKEVLA